MLRTKFWYAFLLIFFFVFAVLYNDYITYLLFLMMLVLPLALWILFLWIKRYVDIKIVTDEYVRTKGVPYDVTIYLKNRSIIPIPKIKVLLDYRNCFTEDRQIENLVTSLNARSEVGLKLSASSDFCGLSEYRLKKMYLFDYLGIFKHKKKCFQEISVAILPSMNVIEDNLAPDNASVLVESELFSSIKSGDDPSELYGIREYEQGDRMNRIHWKLSLKQDELMIKQFGLPINCAVAIMADFYQGTQPITLEKIDAIIETMLTFSLSLVYQEQIHYMIWYDEIKDTCVRVQIEKEEDCYEAAARLYRCRIKNAQHCLAMYHDAQYENEQYTNLFYITSYLDEDTVEILNNLRKQAITHLCMIIREEESFQQLLAYSEGIGIHAHTLRLAHVAEDMLAFE